MRGTTKGAAVRLAAAAGLITALAAPAGAAAQCLGVLRDGDFELQRTSTVSAPWVGEGRTGIDIRRGLAHHGGINAWARHNTGWNAVRQTVRLIGGVNYTLRAFVRTSGNVRDGYFGFRDAAQRPVRETRFGPLPAYTELRVDFRPTATGTFNVFSGFWAPSANAWMQIDHVRVTSPCDDNPGNPIED